jgi:peptide/nickel transport system permease protein
VTIKTYLVRRLALMVLVLFGVATLTFLVARIIPSDPARVYLGGHPDKIAIAKANRELGLDRSLIVQYGMYMKNLVRGDWGMSLRGHTPVLHDILGALPASLELIVASIILATIVGVIFGVITAHMKGTWIDFIMRLFSTAGVSVPAFWLALMLQVLFVRTLHNADGQGWLPAAFQIEINVAEAHPVHSITGMMAVDAFITGNFVAFWDAFKHMIMPVLALSAYSTGVIMRMTRGSMLEAMGLDYIRMARAMGMPTRRLLFKAALKNSMGPVLTIMGLTFAYSLTGTFFIEQIFAWPGLGSYTTLSILSLDYPAIVGVTVMLAGVYVLVNLAVDMVQARIDPRITLS